MVFTAANYGMRCAHEKYQSVRNDTKCPRKNEPKGGTLMPLGSLELKDIYEVLPELT